MNGSTSPKGDAPWISQARTCEAHIYVFLLKQKKSYISNCFFLTRSVLIYRYNISVGRTWDMGQ